MIAIINKNTGEEYPRYFKDKEAVGKFVAETFGSVDKAPPNLQVKMLSDVEYQDRVNKRGAAESKVMQENTVKLKKDITEQEGGIGRYIAPYTQNEEAEGKDPSYVTGLKDVFSLPGRYLSTGFDSDVEDMKKTSEERSDFFEKLLTSPVTGASVATAPLAITGGAILGPMITAGRYGVPLATGGLEAGMGLGVGETMEPNFDNIDRALAIGLPFLSPLVGKVARDIAKKRLAKELLDKGVEVSDAVLEKVMEEVGFLGNLKKIGEKGMKEEAGNVSKGLTMLSPEFNEGVLKSGDAILTNQFNAGKITNAQLKAGKAKLQSFLDANERIYNAVSKGKMTREVADAQILKEFRLLDDVPELQKIAQVALSKEKTMSESSLQALKAKMGEELGEGVSPDIAGRYMAKEVGENPLAYMKSDVTEPYNRYAMNRELASGATGFPKLSTSTLPDLGLSITPRTLVTAGKEVATNPYLVKGASQVLRYSPALERAIRYREGE